MNIWLLTSQFPPAVVGGIARYVANAAEMFARAGHLVTVVTADTVDDETTLPSGARLLRFAPRNGLLEGAGHTGEPDAHPAFPYNVLSYWPALSYELAERVAGYLQQGGETPDVVECQEYGALPYYLLQRRLVERRHPLAAVPLLVHLHSPAFSIARTNQEPQYRLPDYWIGQMERFSILAADGLLAPSRFLGDEVAGELPAAAGRMAVLPYPYLPLPPTEQQLTPGDLVYFGRLEQRKGVPPLVEVCDRLWRQGLDFRLTLIGGDTYLTPRGRSVGTFLRERYGRWIEAGQLVIHDQPLGPAALWQRLATAWAVVIPSTWDNFPNTCIEAMSLGKLVVASTAGGQAEMIGDDGRAGLLFDWAHEGGCADALRRALAFEPAQVEIMGALARQRIAAMTSFDAVLPQRIAHYQHLIDQFNSRPALFPCVTPGITGNTLPPAPDSLPGLLSVVVPFYNLGTYVEETVASVLASSYQPLELVLLDDGSDEPESLAALEQLQQRYGGAVRVVRTANGGLPAARNAGAAASRGEYLAFVDADDLVDAPFFERAVDVLRRFENVSFVYSWVRFFDADNGCWPTWNTELPYLLGHNMLTAFAVLRRSDFMNYGLNSSAVAYGLEDHDAWISMVERGCIGVSLPEMLVRYRLRPGSMYRAMNDTQLLAMLGTIAERHQETYRRFGPELFGLLNANGRSLDWNHPAAAVPSVDSRALQQYAADLKQQHDDLIQSWHAQREHIDRQQQFIDSQQHPIARLEARLRTWWRRR